MMSCNGKINALEKKHDVFEIYLSLAVSWTWKLFGLLECENELNFLQNYLGNFPMP